MRYVLSQTDETKPSLLVDVVQHTDDDVLNRVRRDMLLFDCLNGIVVDPQYIHVLHDTFVDTTPASIVEEARLDTAGLLGTTGELGTRVHQ